MASLVVVTDDHYPPYLFHAEDGSLQGIVKDRWDLWSERNHIPVEIRGTDWATAQASIRDGRADVIDALAETRSRAGDFEFSGDADDTQARLYFRRGLTGITDASSVRDMNVAAKAGSACADWLRGHGVSHVTFYPDSQALVRAASDGDVRVFCMDELAARYFLYRQGLAGDFNEAPPLYATRLRWAVRKGRSALQALIERGFDQ
ncbi:MAG TPA: transporter substrate-binding domain-containing protein, partial [Usitatibacter sp.]